jgi:hypothetical protein
MLARRPYLKLLLGAAALLLAACATPAPPGRVDDACAIFIEKKDWWRASKASERRWGLPPALLLAIVRQESSFTHDARPPRRGGFLFFPGPRASSAYGYAQALDGTWAEYRRATGSVFADRDNFEHASDFIGWYFAESRRRLQLPPTAFKEHYLAYHEGHGGFSRGTHRSKGWLLSVADRVAATARTYSGQIQGCAARLNGGGGLFGLF